MSTLSIYEIFVMLPIAIMAALAFVRSSRSIDSDAGKHFALSVGIYNGAVLLSACISIHLFHVLAIPLPTMQSCYKIAGTVWWLMLAGYANNWYAATRAHATTSV